MVTMATMGTPSAPQGLANRTAQPSRRATSLAAASISSTTLVSTPRTATVQVPFCTISDIFVQLPPIPQGEHLSVILTTLKAKPAFPVGVTCEAKSSFSLLSPRCGFHRPSGKPFRFFFTCSNSELELFGISKFVSGIHLATVVVSIIVLTFPVDFELI